MTETEELKLWRERERLLAGIQQAQQRVAMINQQLAGVFNAENEQSNPES